ncbi:CCHC-type domain-containing protein [Trichonephila inaurata madagascariensis]|uniref:CCHC-type domain-containing protein n=1 Tax=Trichonephila inaurata madagascariensis TaxID=2747483 RepID=A0A8X6XPD1_9ARAC|nr:CCHC-type domain-containing protein [Trichonephila inaurata madagascariensis]
MSSIPDIPFGAPSIFHGEAGDDPSRWFKEYERIAKFNRWDDTICLVNDYFFLKGTARLWYENNEEILSSWEKFQEQIKIAFGSTELFIKQAERERKKRQNTQLESPSLDEVIREEVQQALCPLIPSKSVVVNRRNEPPRRPRTYATVVRQPRHPVEPLPVPRQTDVWKTDDNRPVCFHCGRPGHVVRYCRERRAIFDAYRSRQATNSQLPSPNLSYGEYSRACVTLRRGKREIWVVNGQSQEKVIPQGLCVAFAEPFCSYCIATISESSRVPTKISETKHSFEFLKMISSDLDANQKRLFVDVLQEYSEAFKERKNGTPQITVKHRINTGDNLPIKQRAYRVYSAEHRIIHDEVGKMLDREIIQSSESPWSSPVILVRLKDPSGRLARWALRLQKYDLEIVYKSGKKHKDAHSLSRNPVEHEVFPSEQKTTFASFSDIAEEQRKDLELSKLIHTYEKAEPVTKSFNLIDGILFKKNFDPKGRKWLCVCVPIIPKHPVLKFYSIFMTLQLPDI